LKKTLFLKKYITPNLKKREVLANAKKELIERSKENFDKLSDRDKSLYSRAFTTNEGDPDFHKLTTLNYEEKGQKRELFVPKSDPLYQFRKDVESGQLPTVSWLAGAQNFSSHPSAPWYGSLYISEMLDILTQNPEVWKKTIFIVTFDENDGYYDHIPPFVAPDPKNPKTGKCSNGIPTDMEYIYREDELADGVPKGNARSGPVGLGFRVPMIVASPWSRGGQVCSELFDHTSTLQFLEGFLNKKFNKDIKETNISKWRRTICGDLTSMFRPFHGEKTDRLPFLEKDPFLEKIYNAKFKKTPDDFRALTREEIAEVNKNPSISGLLPQQEIGVRPSCAVPSELYVEGTLDRGKKNFEIKFTANNDVFGNRSLGAPFNVYSSGKNRSYTVVAGDSLVDSWPMTDFDQGRYDFRVHGPNGFFREYNGSVEDPAVEIGCGYERSKLPTEILTGNLELKIANPDPGRSHVVHIVDNAYGNEKITKTVEPQSPDNSVVLNLKKSHGWYDVSIVVVGYDHFERRFAGHVETGKDSYTDPAMGRVII
jgi:phospholipase C